MAQTRDGAESYDGRSPRPQTPPPEPRQAERISPAELHHRLLEQYAPPSVVVTHEFNVVHLSEHVGRYLQLTGGEPSSDLIRLLRPDLRHDVRTALHQAVRERSVAAVAALRVELEGGPADVNVTVRPVLREGDPARGYLLVMFEELPVTLRTDELQRDVEQPTAAQSDSPNLLRMLVKSQEEERTRVARDLHDQLGQLLTALRLVIERARDQSEGRVVNKELERGLELLKQLDAEVGFLAWELRPAALDDLGLAAALPRFVREWSSHYQIAAEYRAAGFQAGHLSREAEVVFYRVAQEALNNVVKHAHASRVDVMLESRDGAVTLVVEDDGIGFDANDNEAGRGIGIMGMAERAGLIGAALQIESSPGEGTSVFLRCAASRPPQP